MSCQYSRISLSLGNIAHITVLSVLMLPPRGVINICVYDYRTYENENFWKMASTSAEYEGKISIINFLMIQVHALHT